ncbi:Rv1733c family protein [Amycolatopsis sp. CA-161197]|uniref:Rv1733c family protein n=1 Tax=Amycolatopsis sp. CA-161197 TaxID=3239922 RepID=UPI003D8A91CD
MRRKAGTMDTLANRLMRWWHAIAPGRDSVARPSDRFQAALLALCVLTALAAVPFAAAAGSRLYESQAAQSAEQLPDRYSVTATLLADGPELTTSGRSGAVGSPKPTDATWELADGSRRVGRVDANEGTHRGDTFPIWVDRSGTPVDPPLTPAAAVVNAAAGATGLWLAACLALATLYGSVAFVLNRRRGAQWQREWLAGQAKRAHS